MTVVLPGKWTERAACADADSTLFFPEQGESGAAAKAICKTCPVLTPCLEYSLIAPSEEGIWGGLNRDERRLERRRRARARRKQVA